MRRIALTGNVASGKSEVARIWKEAGAPVVSADEFSRVVVARGSEGLREVVEAFGPGVLRDDGTLDREAVRARVFRDPEERRRLERILHPRIAEERSRWEEEEQRKGSALAVSEIPLLFEVGIEGRFDAVVFVDAPEEIRLRRLVELRGIDPDEARRMMAAQMDPEEKRGLADYVIENDGTLEELGEEALAVLGALREEASA